MHITAVNALLYYCTYYYYHYYYYYYYYYYHYYYFYYVCSKFCPIGNVAHPLHHISPTPYIPYIPSGVCRWSYMPSN